MSEVKFEEHFTVNVSPVNWYIARILLRFEFTDEDKINLNRRCIAWENQILLKAKNPEKAYEKALKHGKLKERGEMHTLDGKRKGKWIFEGLRGLTPLYNELDDGSEISSTEHGNKTVKKIKDWVLKKEELEVFQKN
jgi:hypothetical protein